MECGMEWNGMWNGMECGINKKSNVHVCPKTSRYFSLVTRPDSKRTLENLSLLAICNYIKELVTGPSLIV